VECLGVIDFRSALLSFIQRDTMRHSDPTPKDEKILRTNVPLLYNHLHAAWMTINSTPYYHIWTYNPRFYSLKC